MALEFPDPELANANGLLAAGGNLESDTLLKAYASGIFPWYAEGSPILWWSPDPRMVLFPGKLKVSKSLGQSIRNKKYDVLMDANFEGVIHHCATIPRKGQSGTWITKDMISAYIALHRAGYAHSVEIYMESQLVGGLYGVSLGGTFFGESMFHLVRDGSKIALFRLVELIKGWDFDLVDIQQSTGHLRRLGAEDIPRSDFLAILKKSLKKETIRGNWSIITRE
jgi:leucyl/phenylalanyl-tRNA--protein transferase